MSSASALRGTASSTLKADTGGSQGFSRRSKARYKRLALDEAETAASSGDGLASVVTDTPAVDNAASLPIHSDDELGGARSATPAMGSAGYIAIEHLLALPRFLPQLMHVDTALSAHATSASRDAFSALQSAHLDLEFQHANETAACTQLRCELAEASQQSTRISAELEAKLASVQSELGELQRRNDELSESLAHTGDETVQCQVLRGELSESTVASMRASASFESQLGSVQSEVCEMQRHNDELSERLTRSGDQCRLASISEQVAVRRLESCDVKLDLAEQQTILLQRKLALSEHETTMQHTQKTKAETRAELLAAIVKSELAASSAQSPP